MTVNIWNRLLTALLVAALLFAAAIYLPNIVGIKPLIVLSGSMEPNYPVGSLVYVQKRAPEQLKKGDVVTFYLSKDTVVTHRIVAVDSENRKFQTKGDANDTADGTPVLFQNCIGTPILSVPKLGYVADFLGTVSGKILYITGILVLLLLLYVTELIWPQKGREGKHEKG